MKGGVAVNEGNEDLLTRTQFLQALNEGIRDRYLDRHPLMQMLYAGRLTRKHVKAWIINRFYLQKNIPIKDAAILSNCPELEVRKLWIGRILKREGLAGSIGDVEGWVSFAEAAGIRRADLLRASCLPGVRFAVDGFVNFARQATWTEGVAASLFEYLAKVELVKRIEALKKHYSWIDPSGLRFFMSRLGQLEEANETTLSIVLRYSKTRKTQLDAIGAASFAADVNWSLYDTVYMAYVIQDRPLPIQA